MNGIYLLVLILLGALLSYVDHQLKMGTILVETVHALVVTAILIFCLFAQKRNPEINQFGWRVVVWGVFLLMIGSWVDILDDPPVIEFLNESGIPFGRSWQQAFIKKILGYTVGIGLIAIGFFRWVPWMIQSRLTEHKLNQQLGATNKKLNAALMSIDDHVESERAHISRELHDDVAQELTYFNVQLQLLEKSTSDDPLKEKLVTLRHSMSDTLKRVRDISQGLRPESLYSLGFLAALEQFIEKTGEQHTDMSLQLTTNLSESKRRLDSESSLDERQLLHLYRVVQEGIRNAIKHSGGKSVTVSIHESQKNLFIEIIDDGNGLPWAEMPPDESLIQSGHLGLVGLKERITELSGSLDLSNNRSGGGATLRLEIHP